MKRPDEPLRTGGPSLTLKDLPDALRPVRGQRLVILRERPSTLRPEQARASLGSREIRRIRLGDAAGRYIGETEKNLEALLGRAPEHGIVLFFDEADALFGKRTEVRESHDRYANQETSLRAEAAREILRYALRTWPLAGLMLDLRTPVPEWLKAHVVSIVDG